MSLRNAGKSVVSSHQTFFPPNDFGSAMETNDMDSQLERALRLEAQLLGVLDTDILGLPDFDSIKSDIKTEADIGKAVRAMRDLKPSLFRATDWGDLRGSAFQSAEVKFRESLRRSKPVGPNEWRDIDASRLNAVELDALSKAIGGQVNAFDRGLLTRALARQKAEDSALGGDAA